MSAAHSAVLSGAYAAWEGLGDVQRAAHDAACSSDGEAATRYAAAAGQLAVAHRMALAAITELRAMPLAKARPKVVHLAVVSG